MSGGVYMCVSWRVWGMCVVVYLYFMYVYVFIWVYVLCRVA